MQLLATIEIALSAAAPWLATWLLFRLPPTFSPEAVGRDEGLQMVFAGGRRLRAEAWLSVFPFRVEGLSHVVPPGPSSVEEIREVRQSVAGLRTLRRMSFVAGAVLLLVAAVATGGEGAVNGVPVAALLALPVEFVLALYATTFERAAESVVRGLAALQSGCDESDNASDDRGESSGGPE